MTNLGELPEPPGDGYELRDDVTHFLAEAALLAVVSRRDAAEDLIDGRVGRQRTVEDVELSLEALRDVVAAAAWLDHRCQELQAQYTVCRHNTQC